MFIIFNLMYLLRLTVRSKPQPSTVLNKARGEFSAKASKVPFHDVEPWLHHLVKIFTYLRRASGWLISYS